MPEDMPSGQKKLDGFIPQYEGDTGTSETPETDAIMARAEEEQKAKDDAWAKEKQEQDRIMNSPEAIRNGESSHYFRSAPPPAPGESAKAHLDRIETDTRAARGASSQDAIGIMSPEHSAADKALYDAYSAGKDALETTRKTADKMREEERIKTGKLSQEQEQYRQRAGEAQAGARSSILSNRGVGGAMSRRMANRVGSYVGSVGNQGEQIVAIQRKQQAIQRWAEWAISQEADQNGARANAIKQWAQTKAMELQKDIDEAQSKSTTGWGRYVGGAIGATAGAFMGGPSGAAAGWNVGSGAAKSTENLY